MWRDPSLTRLIRSVLRNLPDQHSALSYTRYQMDRLKIGEELTYIPWGSVCPKLPPSSLIPKQQLK